MLKRRAWWWRKWGPALAVCACCALFPIAMWIAVDPSSHYPPCKQNETPKEAKCYEESTSIFGRVGVWIDRNHDNIGAASTAIIAIFTFSLWFATRGLRSAARGQITEAKGLAVIAQRQIVIQGIQTQTLMKQHLITNRPRLRVRHVSVVTAEHIGLPTLFFDHRNKIDGVLVVVNVGGTAARIVESFYHVYFSQGDLPMISPLEDVKRRQLLIPEGQIIGIGESRSCPIPDIIIMKPNPDPEATTIMQFDSGGWKIYVMGQIRYQDDGGHDRFMGFCREGDGKSRFRAVDNQDYEYED
jgi:hypothetical protein